MNFRFLYFDNSPSTRVRIGVSLCLTLLLVLGLYQVRRSPSLRPWAHVPAGTYVLGTPEAAHERGRRTVETTGFSMQRTEVTVGQFVRFLNQTRPEIRFASPQIDYSGGKYAPRTDARHPVAYVTYADAVAYADWAGRKRRRTVRLPTADEWEIAARSGRVGIRYPWGWAEPASRAQFDQNGMTRVASYAPNHWGLYDMAGNVAEWCLTEDNSSTAYVLGGSWAERDADQLRVFHRHRFRREYRDADVGFRVIKESR